MSYLSEIFTARQDCQLLASVNLFDCISNKRDFIAYFVTVTFFLTHTVYKFPEFDFDIYIHTPEVR